MEAVYRERANGRFEFWVYSDGLRVMVTESWVQRELRRKNARLICLT